MTRVGAGVVWYISAGGALAVTGGACDAWRGDRDRAYSEFFRFRVGFIMNIEAYVSARRARVRNMRARSGEARGWPPRGLFWKFGWDISIPI